MDIVMLPLTDTQALQLRPPAQNQEQKESWLFQDKLF